MLQLKCLLNDKNGNWNAIHECHFQNLNNYDEFDLFPVFGQVVRKDFFVSFNIQEDEQKYSNRVKTSAGIPRSFMSVLDIPKMDL